MYRIRKIELMFYHVELRKRFLFWTWWKLVMVPKLVVRQWGITTKPHVKELESWGTINECKNMFNYLRNYHNVRHWYRGYSIYAIMNADLNGVVYYCDKYDNDITINCEVYETIKEWYPVLDKLIEDKNKLKLGVGEDNRAYQYDLRRIKT